ncbi:hypothetical protein ID866_9248 [Astraeus odoratus]|nr:hypothetical protein ID866_9248 [Astraeus odoratus]
MPLDLADVVKSVKSQLKEILPTSHAKVKPDHAQTYCTTCSAISIKQLLRDGLPQSEAVPIGLLLDIMKRSDRCILCRLISTLIRRRWHLDDHPNVDLDGIECSMSARDCGTLDPRLKDRKRCHRLCIHWSNCPSEILNAMVASSTHPSLEIQLLEEDAHKFSRRRDLHGRKVNNMVDVGLIKTWIHLCESEHGDSCESVWWRAEGESLPQFVRMVDVVQMSLVHAPPNCRYVALSYVWGGPGDHYWTTIANATVRGRPSGLDESILPATILDSIHLVRQLGERYLWIDALCIIQDSDEDKADQIHIMDLIYSKATFTVFAAGGDSARAGLPGMSAGTRTPEQHVQVVQGLHLALPLPTLREVIKQSYWNTRGWTFQELVLSRRRIFFTKEQVYFECVKDIWCEDVVGESKTLEWTRTPLRHNGVGMFLRSSTSGHWQLRGYVDTATTYSQRNLTQESDIIAAMTALTNAMSKGYEPPGRNPKDAFRFSMYGLFPSADSA